MALTSYTKNSTTTTTLDNGTVWVGGVIPASSTDSQTIWNSTSGTVSNALGTSKIWGQIVVTSPTGTCTIAATTSTALTLTPTSYGDVGIDLSAATQNFTIAEPIVLGSSQEWKVASGRTLTISGTITGNAKTLTLTGPGAFSLTANNTTTLTNSTIAVNGGTQWTMTTAGQGNAAGAATNVIDVKSGANVSLGASAAVILPTSILLSGTGPATGVNGSYSAFWANYAQAVTRTFTFYGSRTIFQSMNSLATTTTHAAKFTGTTTAETVFLISFNTILSNTANDFVAGGNGVEIQSKQTNGSDDGRYYLILSGDISDTAVFGNTANHVFIEGSGAFQTTAATTTRTISRNIKIDGHRVNSATDLYHNSATRLNLTGTLTLLGTGGFSSTFDSATSGTIALAGTLTGSGNMSLKAGGTIEFASGLTASGYTGAIDIAAGSTLKYGTGVVTSALTMAASAILDNPSASLVTLSHASYATGNSFTFTGSFGELNTGSGNFSGPLNTITVSGSRLSIPGNIVSTQPLTRAGAGTLALSGNNTIPTALTLSGGTLELNSAGSAGANGFTFANVVGNILDSTTGATLTQTGINTFSGDVTWKGTASLTFGNGSVTTGADRVVSFTNTGATGTLKFSGAITTSTATLTWNIGGSVANAKQRFTLGGANASLVAATAADQHQVTAGYFRIENNDGLGAAATTTAWWVGATNAGTTTTGSALELAGVTTPNTKNVNLHGTGPNSDGALIGASGTSTFQGSISVPNVAGTRVGVAAGATLTLDGAGIYPNLNPAVANTPMSFTAGAGGTLNQNRVLGGGGTSNVSTVTIANGTGTVVLSRANLHTGAMTCSAGTTKITNAAATGAGAGNTVTVTAGASFETTVKATFASTLTLGSSSTPAIFKVSV